MGRPAPVACADTGSAPGEQLGAYTLLGVAGAGSTSVVHHARHQATGGLVAVKSWRVPLDATGRRRFARECRLHWAMSGSAGIARMHTASRVDAPRPWLAMELFDESLAHRLRRGPVDRHTALRAARAVVDGVSAMHAAGLLHRDVNPANVLLTESRAALADLGSADHVRRPGADPAEGTPPFVAPEAMAGAPPSVRSDVFSVGATVRAVVGPHSTPEIARALRCTLTPDPRWRVATLGDLDAALRAAVTPRRR